MFLHLNKYMLGDFMIKMTLYQTMKLKACIRRGMIKDMYKRGIIMEKQFRHMMSSDDYDA